MLRSDLDPVAIPKLLPNLILSDVADAGHSIRYRLVGTNIVQAHGSDYTGLTIKQLTSGSTLEFTRRLYGVVVGVGLPVYSEGSFRWDGMEFRWTKRLHLPLTRDGLTINMVLAGQVFEPENTGGAEMILNASADQVAADQQAAVHPADVERSAAPGVDRPA